MMRISIAVVAFAALQAASGAVAQEGGAAVSLRVDGNEIPLSATVRVRLAGLAHETLKLCGPNTRQHPHNFGGARMLAPLRRERTLETSRLHVVYDRPFESVSHLGGTLRVSEVTLGLGGKDLFVGPDFTRHGAQVMEHLHCEYLPSLEIACLPELAAHLPRVIAKLARGSSAAPTGGSSCRPPTSRLPAAEGRAPS